MMDKLVKSEVYRFLFENSNDALLLTNPDGHVYRANPAACEMFQRSEEEICTLGRSGLVDLSDPRLAPALEERATKGRVRAELNFIRKDSSVFPTECASAIFQDEIGDIWTVIILRDMTSIKAAESSFTFSRFLQINAIMGKRNSICFKKWFDRASRVKGVLLALCWKNMHAAGNILRI